MSLIDLPTALIKTALWQRTLGLPEAEVLRQAFLQMRGRVAHLVGEIHRYLPTYTVHDISHLDALWDVANLLAGEDYPLTPAEGFVLGGAILLHDAAMSLAAWPGGWVEIEADPRWRDLIAARLRRQLGRAPLLEEIVELSQEDRDEVIAAFLRELHAEQAERLATAGWVHQGEHMQLLENGYLRHHYGTAIGRIAHSHWWHVSRLEDKLTRSLGAPGDLPREWRVDQIKVAVLLRCADAAHLDDRRSPRFLAALRGIRGLSDEHWTFQGRLLQHEIDKHGRLKMSAGKPFGLGARKAWWRCYEAARMVDEELRQSDDLLADTGRPRLAASAVAGVEEPRRFARQVEPDGWEPVETRVRVTDVPSLVERLGGSILYGDDPTVPLRELIQNALDAVRARRVLEQRPDDWGEVTVRRGEDANGKWIEVDDTGIGMSIEVLTGPLLDFGMSYWSAPLVRREHPGLLAGGFEPIGQFGIGFFSVFMWGERVRVTTRRSDDGTADTRVLEFETGLHTDPLLRPASREEQRREGGTCVRVWIKSGKQPSDNDSNLSPHTRRSAWPLQLLIAWLCPAVDVTIWAVELDGERIVAVRGNDWRTLSGKQLLQRITPAEEVWPRQFPEREAIIEAAGQLLDFDTAFLDSHSRASLDTRSETGEFGLSIGVVTVGGIRAQNVSYIVGIISGRPTRATRTSAMPGITWDAQRTWVERQTVTWAQHSSSDLQKHSMARLFIWCGLAPLGLPVALTREGWLDSQALREWARARSCVVIAGGDWYTRGNEFAAPAPARLSDNVLWAVGDNDYESSFDEFFIEMFQDLKADCNRPGAYFRLGQFIEDLLCDVWGDHDGVSASYDEETVPFEFSSEDAVMGTRKNKKPWVVRALVYRRLTS